MTLRRVMASSPTPPPPDDILEAFFLALEQDDSTNLVTLQNRIAVQTAAAQAQLIASYPSYAIDWRRFECRVNAFVRRRRRQLFASAATPSSGSGIFCGWAAYGTDLGSPPASPPLRC